MANAGEIVARIGTGSRVLVVGLGRSGLAAVRLLKKLGAEVAVSEGGPHEEIDPATLAWLEEHEIGLECGGHGEKFFTGAELIVVSPGVPLTIPALAKARTLGVPILGELALAASLVAAPIIAVTGTNGKSTVTELLGEIFRNAGRPVFVGGNLGTPLAEYLLGPMTAEVLVLEVSSFQLDTAPGFQPAVALLLNISPDHLDRYPDYESYAAAKFAVFAAQNGEQAAVLNGDDPEVLGRLARYPVPARTFFFGRASDAGNRQAGIAGSEITVSGLGAAPEIYELAGTSLAREPNVHNAAAAILGARLLGCPPAAVRRALARFRPLAHRLALVAEIDGVQYFDDSKATNIGAVVAALAGMDRPVVLIGGGRDKGGDYRLLHQAVREKVRGMVLIGEAREKMAASFAAVTRVELAESLAAAVLCASRLARPGQAVLLAPACASFDMFSGYAERGRIFRQAVAGLAQKSEEEEK
jgi:UDP-N-acetylmuramoylalanine--D-glutamate ligase